MEDIDKGQVLGCLLPLACLCVVAIGFLLHLGWDLYEAM